MVELVERDERDLAAVGGRGGVVERAAGNGAERGGRSGGKGRHAGGREGVKLSLVPGDVGVGVVFAAEGAGEEDGAVEKRDEGRVVHRGTGAESGRENERG